MRTRIAARLGAAMVVSLSTTASLLWAQDALTIAEQPLQPGDALRVSFSMETVLNGGNLLRGRGWNRSTFRYWDHDRRLKTRRQS